MSCCRTRALATETGLDGTDVAVAASGPVGWAGQLGIDYVGDIVQTVEASSLPEDALRFPYRDDVDGIHHNSDALNIPGAEWPGSPVSQLYVEAFARIDRVIAATRACGLSAADTSQVETLRAALATLLNRGVYLWSPGALSPFSGSPDLDANGQMYVAEAAERPRVGEVRAALNTFATRLGQMCSRATLNGVASGQGLPADVVAQASAPFAATASSSAAWWVTGALVAAAVVGVVVWRRR